MVLARNATQLVLFMNRIDPDPREFNPFDTKPMAKIAVNMSIMRVVKFMSS